MGVLFGSILSLGGLCLAFAALLAIANKKLAVEEDPRVEKVFAALPGVNCGGCGFPGCHAFAEHIVAGDAPLNGCAPGGHAAAEQIAAVMGVTVEKKERRVAVVLCNGGHKEAAQSAAYYGVQGCRAAMLVAGGGKQCQYGCLGFGDCVAACVFDAMTINDNGLPVVDREKCTACGKCVEACPRKLIELHAESHRMFAFCKSQDKGAMVKKACSVGCIGCGICAKNSPVEHGIVMGGNLPIINYDLCPPSEIVAQKCPTKTIRIL